MTKKQNETSSSLSFGDPLEEPVLLLEEPAVSDSPPAAVPEKPLSDGKDTLPLKTFLVQKFGKRVDQAGGFIHYAGKQKLKRLTRKDWDAAYDAFMARKIGS